MTFILISSLFIVLAIASKFDEVDGIEVVVNRSKIDDRLAMDGNDFLQSATATTCMAMSGGGK